MWVGILKIPSAKFTGNSIASFDILRIDFLDARATGRYRYHKRPLRLNFA